MSDTARTDPFAATVEGRGDETTVAAPAPHDRAAPDTSIDADVEQHDVGVHIGRYAILRKVGEGGMGSVFVGYDESLDRKVAVKVLHRGAIAEQWLLREAQALAKLSHPNVVHVFEVGHHDGRVFLAMEFVEGVTLREHISPRNKPIGELLATFVQAGRGLAAAHEAGLVHRDFKPDNVLVGHDGRARVVDFGIAALAEKDAYEPTKTELSEHVLKSSPSALHSPLTRAGTLLGTPAFMSPEQFRGERATAASDQFSFCVALYEAAYGQDAFLGETVRDLSENVKSGRLQAPPKQSTAPEWLSPILTRGLSNKPEDRYPNLTALLDEIERHLPKGPVDPSVRREQMLLGVLLGAVSLSITASLALEEGPPTSHARYIFVGTVMAAAVCGLVAALWRTLRKSARGRTIAAILVSVGMALVGQRLLVTALSIPVLLALVLDCYLLFMAFAIGTLLLAKRLWPILILGVFGLAAMAADPQRAKVGIALFSIVSLGAMSVAWDKKK